MKKSLTVRATAFIVGIFMIIASCPFFTACGNGEKPKVETLTVRDITLDTSEAKTEFAYGEEFTAEGLKVTAILSDGSNRDIPLKSCRISKVNNTPGRRKVSVTYARKTKRYEVVFLDKPMPPISETSLLDISGENVYRVQAEAIDLEVSGVKHTGEALLLTGGGADGEKYIGNYGVAENYFGFTFTADKDYDNATAVLRVANPSAENALYFGGEMSVHLNYHGTNENGSLGIANSAAISKSEENAPVWCDFALRGLNIKEGTNTLTFSIFGENVPYIDYVDFYIGSEFSNSAVTLAGAGGKTVKDFEDLSVEKVVTRDDYMEAYHPSTGEICVLPNAQANGGSAVYALMNGQATTLITAEEDSTVQIIINAASHIDWRFMRDAEIKLDGEVITFNEHNIRAGTETEEVWKETSLGFFDLTAGEHLLDIKINSPHAKFDSVTFKTLSKGKFVEHPQIYLDEIGTQVMEGEHLDSSNVVVRQDYSELVIGATHGKYNTRTEQTASGWKYIDGFTGFPEADKNPYNPGTTEKTVFSIDFYLAADATVEINAVACSTLGVNFSNRGEVLVKIDGKICSPMACNLAQYHKGNGKYNDPRWIDTQLARKNLEAGAHTFTFEILNFFFDLDCIKFKAVSMDGYQPDAVIDGTGTYYLEAERFDSTGFKAAQDFLDAGAIGSPTDEYCIRQDGNPHGGSYICGFAGGTKVDNTTYTGGAYVTGYFELKEASTLRISVRARASIGIAFKRPYEFGFKIDDTEETPASFLQPKATLGALQNTFADYEIADIVRLEKGVHSVKAIAGQYGSVDLDCIILTVIGYGENADGKSIDINLNGAGEQKFEAEWIDDCDVKLQSGQTAAEGKDFPVFTTDNPSNGMFVGGLNTGTILNIHFNNAEQANVKITASVRAGIPVQIWNQSHCKIYVDGELISPPAAQGDLSSAFAEKILFEGNLSAGDHVMKIEMNPFGFDIDYFKFVVSNATAA